jgi:hypothetical protein
MNAAIQERKPATEEISGVIERVIFHNDDSGFCCTLRLKPEGERRGLQSRGEHYEDGYCHQLQGIERYLGSGLIKASDSSIAKERKQRR